MKGTVKIDYPEISCGMIRMGFRSESLYLQSKRGIVWENNGKVVFKGKCLIGYNSAIRTGKGGCLEFGNNFGATAAFRIGCFKKIVIGNNCRFSWENIVLDTDCHETINKESGERSVMIKSIVIGDNNWIGLRCVILKGTVTPNFCTFSAGSLLCRKYDVPEYSLLAGSPLVVVKSNVYMDTQSLIQ
jgi:acetyltransferase-like isoleucine patch superfamily enzyme